jgi:hypothetical protein
LSHTLRATHPVSIDSGLGVVSFVDAYPKNSRFVESPAGEIVEATNTGITKAQESPIRRDDEVDWRDRVRGRHGGAIIKF